MIDLTKPQLQQQYEGTRLAAAAYGAADIKALIATNPSQHQLTAGLHNVLITQGSSIDQANSFVQKFTQVASLDKDGGRAILFRVNGTDQIATENGGMAPAWQVQTQLGHMQQLLAQGAGQGEIKPSFDLDLCGNAGIERYAFDSCSRRFNGCQRGLLFISANA